MADSIPEGALRAARKIIIQIYYRGEHPTNHSDVKWIESMAAVYAPIIEEETGVGKMREALQEILSTEPLLYTQTGGIDDYEPLFLPPALTPYAGPLAVIFKVARAAVESEAKG